MDPVKSEENSEMEENLKTGERIQRGHKVTIMTDSGNIYMRARVKSVGSKAIILIPLPGEAKSGGLKE